jgi:replicative superfamily II helicase
MEWLMEENKLRVLVATTTIAQGINFPVSAILRYYYLFTLGMDKGGVSLPSCFICVFSLVFVLLHTAKK